MTAKGSQTPEDIDREVKLTAERALRLDDLERELLLNDNVSSIQGGRDDDGCYLKFIEETESRMVSHEVLSAVADRNLEIDLCGPIAEGKITGVTVR